MVHQERGRANPTLPRASAGKARGDIRDPRVLCDILTMLLEEHLDRLEGQAQPAGGHVVDSGTGRIVPTTRAKPAPDPREDRTACAIATLIGYVQDEGRR